MTVLDAIIVRCPGGRMSKTVPACVLTAALNNARPGVPEAIRLDDCDERRPAKGSGRGR
jgi:hypothetical protein